MAELAKLINHYYEGDEPWSGFLYRSGSESGLFFHTSKEGAEYYEQSSGEKVQKYKIFPSAKTIVIDIDHQGEPEELLNAIVVGVDYLEGLVGESSGDVALDIEEALPLLKEKGFDAVVVVGETGSDVWGSPVEVVNLTGVALEPISEVDEIADQTPEVI